MNYRPRLSLILKGLTEITDQTEKLSELSLAVSETMGFVQIDIEDNLIPSSHHTLQFQKELFFAEVAKTTPQLYCLEFDFEDNILAFNSSLAKMAGSKLDSLSFTFGSFQHSISSKDRPKIVTELVKNFGKKDAFEVPLSLITGKKETNWKLRFQYLFLFEEPVRIIGALIPHQKAPENFSIFQSIFDSVPQPTLFIHPNGIIQAYNQKAKPFFLKVFDQDLKIHQPITQFLKGELYGIFDSIIQQTLQGESFKKSYHLKNIRGNHRWIEVNTFPIFEKSNLSFEGIVVQFSDITTDKSKTETADQSTQKLSLALGLTGSGAWEYDLENNRFWWSKEHINLFGIPEITEPSEANFLNSIFQEDRNSFTKALYFAIQSKTEIDQTFRINHPKDGIRWIHCKGIFHFDHVAETNKLIAIETDVTEHLEQEKRIERAERTLKDLIKVVPVGIFKTNLEGLCNFLNDQGEKIIGVTKTEAEGFGWTKNLEEKDRIRFFSRWQQLISGEDENEVIEDNLAFSHPHEVRQVMVNLKVERNPNGTPVGFVGTLTDISPIIQNEKKIKRLNEILVTQYNKLRKYAHINSHDLRGPLTTIMSILNVLRSGDTKLDREYLDALLKSSDKMDSVIKELNELLKDVEFEDVVGENYEITQSLNVMLIDDDPFQNLINSKVVSNQNANIVVHDFNEAHKALELLINKTMEPDFILLDLSMPIMNGWEFLEEMERNKLDVQVHILTSSINPNDFVRAKSFKNVKGFLSKPLKAELVDAIISRYIPLR